MNSFFAYYLMWIALSYVLRAPWLLLGLLVLVVLRRFVPGPGALFRMLGRARSLRGQVEVNRANVTARRDLAVVYLEGMRARKAVPLLEEGLALSPDDAELLYLLGLALHRAGRHEEALAPLVRAVELDPRVRYGLPYAVAGDALAALERWDSALDAYEHYLVDNSSDVSAYTRLARAHARTGDPKAARETLREGIRTWGVLPGSMKRRQFGRYLAAQWARVSVLREPQAIAAFLAMSAIFVVGVRFTYAPVVRWFSTPWTPYAAYGAPYELDPRLAAEDTALHEGFALCGSQSTGDFAGHYRVDWERSKLVAVPAHATEQQRQALKEFERYQREHYSHFEIKSDRIVSGKPGQTLEQEFCLTKVLERTPNSLVADSVWHEDVHDPGDASMVRIELEREGNRTKFRARWVFEPEGGPAFDLELERD